MFSWTLNSLQEQVELFIDWSINAPKTSKVFAVL